MVEILWLASCDAWRVVDPALLTATTPRPDGRTELVEPERAAASPPLVIVGLGRE